MVTVYYTAQPKDYSSFAGDSIFTAELQRLTIHCEFGAHLDEALRDRFVCGLASETIQKRLLTEKELTLSGAIDIAHGMESAAYHARALQGGAQ